MTSRRNARRYRKTQGRRVWVFSELNRDLRPDQLAKILTAAGLEQARLEVEARAQKAAAQAGGDSAEAQDKGEPRDETDDGGRNV